MYAVISTFPMLIQGEVVVQSQEKNMDSDPVLWHFLQRLSQDYGCPSFLVISLISTKLLSLSKRLKEIITSLEMVIQQSDTGYVIVFEAVFVNKSFDLLDSSDGVRDFFPYLLPPLKDRPDLNISTSVFSKLLDVLELLTISNKCAIRCATDVSRMHIDRLSQEIKNLTTDMWLRKQQVDKFGLEGWRELIFRKQWELALYEAGRLNRWWIIVGKKV